MTHDYEEALTEFNWADGINDNANRGLTKKTKLAIKSALQLAMDSGWRDIESAPRDGRTILVWHKDYDHGAGVSYWSDVYEKFMVGGRKQPTMWAPLTQPPEASE